MVHHLDSAVNLKVGQEAAGVVNFPSKLLRVLDYGANNDRIVFEYSTLPFLICEEDSAA